MGDCADLDSIIGLLPRRSVADELRELEAARRAAQDAPPPEPTIIPMPEHRGLMSGVIAYPCALGCAWAHEETPWTEQIGPIVFRPKDPDSLSKALTESAERSAAEMRARIESAIRAHFAEAHPGQAIPTRSLW